MKKVRSKKELNLITQLGSNFTTSIRRTPFGIIITCDVKGHGVSALPNEITFELHLEGKYPF